MSTTTVRTPPSTSHASSSTTSSAPRRRARCGSARRRPPSRPRSSRATRPLHPRPARRAARGRGGRAATSSERLYRLRKTCEAGSSRAELAEQEDALENALLARARDVRWRGAAAARRRRRGSRCSTRTQSATSSASSSAELGRGFNPTAPRRCSRRASDLEAELSGERRPRRAQRGGEGDLAAASSSDVLAARRRRVDRGVRAAARDAGSTGCSAPSATTCRRTRTSPTCAGCRRSSRRITKERAVEVCLDDGSRARLRPRSDPEHPPRPRGPAAEEPARLRDRRRTRRRSST